MDVLRPDDIAVTDFRIELDVLDDVQSDPFRAVCPSARISFRVLAPHGEYSALSFWRAVAWWFTREVVVRRLWFMRRD